MSRRRFDSEHTNKQAGSSESGEPVFLVVGKIRKPHGVRGEIEMEVHTDFPERILPGKVIFIGEQHRPYKILSVRISNKGLLIHFDDLSNPEEAGLLRNELVYVQADELPKLPEGEYYYHEVLGLKVVDVNNQLIGTLQEILTTGANDVYVVINENGKEILIPAIKSVLINVDLDMGEILVDMPEWQS